MLKWRMHTKEVAYACKKNIQSTADKYDFISLADAKRIAFEFPDIKPEDEIMGWRWSDLKGGSGMRIVMVDSDDKTQQYPYLYICEPTINIQKITTNPENKSILEMNQDDFRVEIPSEKARDKAFLDYMFEKMKEILANNRDGRLKCMIWKKSRKKDVEVDEWPCWFHCWTSNRIAKDDGTVVDQLLAVCQFQDGHVERINYDHIRFVDEWD